MFVKKSLLGEKLPPTLDALLLHLRRACYQCFIWKSACKPVLSLPTPIGNGWKGNDVDGSLKPGYMVFESAPNNVLELVPCKCKKGCQTNSCYCSKANLNCCAACLCEHCENDDIEETGNETDDEEI